MTDAERTLEALRGQLATMHAQNAQLHNALQGCKRRAEAAERHAAIMMAERHQWLADMRQRDDIPEDVVLSIKALHKL